MTTIINADCLRFPNALTAAWDHLSTILVHQAPTLGQDLDDLADWIESGEGR